MNEKSNPLQYFGPEELLKFLEEGLMLTDLAGNILSLNNAGSTVFGYGNSQELVGKNLRDLFWKPEDFDIIRNVPMRLIWITLVKVARSCGSLALVSLTRRVLRLARGSIAA